MVHPQKNINTSILLKNQKRDIIFIGDSLEDYRAARNLG